jgi:hypothetical protein
MPGRSGQPCRTEAARASLNSSCRHSRAWLLARSQPRTASVHACARAASSRRTPSPRRSAGPGDRADERGGATTLVGTIHGPWIVMRFRRRRGFRRLPFARPVPYGRTPDELTPAGVARRFGPRPRPATRLGDAEDDREWDVGQDDDTVRTHRPGDRGGLPRPSRRARRSRRRSLSHPHLIAGRANASADVGDNASSRERPRPSHQSQSPRARCVRSDGAHDADSAGS